MIKKNECIFSEMNKKKNATPTFKKFTIQRRFPAVSLLFSFYD